MTNTDCECLASLRSCFPFTPRLLSTGNAIFLFCQATAGLCDCLCDLRLFCSLIFQDVVALCFHVLLLRSLSWAGTKWLNSSSKAGRFTFMQTRGRWEPELLDVLIGKKQNHFCVLSVCYIVLHVLSSSTCRTKRSSWRTLRPHRRPASTFGSAVWRTRLSTSEFSIDCF